MPTPNRTLLHTREIKCRGFQCQDDHWDIEATLSDVKSYSFHNRDRGEIKAGEPIHLLHICLRIDIDMCIHDIQTRMEFTPYGYCSQADRNMKKLIGLQIGPGWMRQVRKKIGGTKGCTHLYELLGPLATTAFQTTFPIKSKQAKPTSTGIAQKNPPLLDSCHSFASDGPIVKAYWPEFHTKDTSEE